MTTGTDGDLQVAARAVAELASDEMHRAEAEGKLTDPVIDAIRDGGLLRLWIPRSLGGEEMDVVSSLDFIETLSYGDPSAGWVVFAGGLIGGTTAAYCGPECVDALFAPGEPLPWVSGHGTRPGTAVPAGDGWTLSGSWSFGSGLLHATHTHNLAIVEGTGEARIFVTPVSDAHLLRDSWDVLGLRATGSIDYTIDGAFVPYDWSHAAGQTSSERGGLLYNLGIIGFVTLGHAAWALGLGRRMLDELIGLVEAKAGRAGAQAEDPAFLEGFQVAEARLRSARALVHETWGDVAASFAAGDEMTVPSADARPARARERDLLRPRGRAVRLPRRRDRPAQERHGHPEALPRHARGHAAHLVRAGHAPQHRPRAARARGRRQGVGVRRDGAVVRGLTSVPNRHVEARGRGVAPS